MLSPTLVTHTHILNLEHQLTRKRVADLAELLGPIEPPGSTRAAKGIDPVMPRLVRLPHGLHPLFWIHRPAHA